MPEMVLVAALCCVAMTAAVVRMLRPSRRAETLARAVTTAVVAATIAVAAGELTQADTVVFLLSSSFATAPASVLLSAAAEDARPGSRRVAWTLSLVWGGVVFPLCSVVPPLVFRACGTPECRVEDFGGGLALLGSAAAAVLLAWRTPAPGKDESWVRFALPVGAIWGFGTVWLASLEGVVDAYTPRIVFAAIMAPLGAALAWTVADTLRRASRHPLRSAADGLLVGLVAILPGAATISFPWTLAVGALAGAAASIVYGLRRLSKFGRAGHWALVVLTSTAIGYWAPAVSGDSIGFFFSGRITALGPPVVAFLAVVAVGAVLTAPVWALSRSPK